MSKKKKNITEDKAIELLANLIWDSFVSNKKYTKKNDSRKKLQVHNNNKPKGV